MNRDERAAIEERERRVMERETLNQSLILSQIELLNQKISVLNRQFQTSTEEYNKAQRNLERVAEEFDPLNPAAPWSP